MGKRNVPERSGQMSVLESSEVRLRRIREEIYQSMRCAVLDTVYGIFQEELETVCGKSWSRKDTDQPRRGGSEKGSVYFEGKRVPVTYPRVVDESGSHALEAYHAMRDFDLFSEEIQQGLIKGLSTRDYSQVVGKMAEGTGISSTTVSRAFVKASKKSLDQITGRDLSKETFLAIFIDGLEFKEVLLIVAMGVTEDGRKVILGLQEGATENADTVSALLDNLQDRGLTLTDQFMAVIDGAKALRSALKKRFTDRILIQRCQEHKKRNVADKLPEKYRSEVYRRMSATYGLRDYAEALNFLRKTTEWLRQISEPAAASLAEGMEETLTVVRLGLPEILRKTFSSTNPLESCFDGVRQRTGRVKNWKGKSQMVARWTASALQEIEKRFRRVRGYKQLGILNRAMNPNKERIELEQKTA